jgi:exopolysaccharide biosynthesis operon protein EpsL
MLSCLPNKTQLSSLRAAGVRRACLLVAALSASNAIAGPNDALHVYGGLGYGYDDNLLRVASGQPGFNNQRGDSWYLAEAGLLFDHTYSRQRISGHAKFSKLKFDYFSQLDYNGEDAEAKWDWQVGNHLEGTLGANYTQTLAPYTDLNSSQRNLRQQHRFWWDGAWRFHPSYRVRAAASKEKFSYELAAQSFNDRTEDSFEIGADYLPASGSEVGLVWRKFKGKYPNPRPFGQQLVNFDYDQDDFKAKVLWLASGSTTVQALVGWTKRRQPGLGNDLTGVTGHINATWKPNGKVSYTAALWRDFAPIESPIVSYTFNKGASVGATWEASAKLKVDANAIYEQRAYNARDLAVAARGGLDDSISSASVRLTWLPRTTLQLSAALMHQQRTGSQILGIGGFTSNSILLNANAQF